MANNDGGRLNLNLNEVPEAEIDAEEVALHDPFEDQLMLPAPDLNGQDLNLYLGNLAVNEHPAAALEGGGQVEGEGPFLEHHGVIGQEPNNNDPAIKFIIARTVSQYQVTNMLVIPRKVQNYVNMIAQRVPGQPANWVTVYFQNVALGVLVGPVYPLILILREDGVLVTSRPSWATFRDLFHIVRGNQLEYYHSVAGPINRFGLRVLAE